MGKANRGLLSLVFFVGVMLPISAQTQILPHLAVGGPPSGAHFQTIIFLSNPGLTAVSGTAQIYDDNGNALPVVLRSDPQSSFDWVLGAGQTQRYVLSGRNDNIESGWMRLTTVNNRPVGVALTYQFFDGANLLSEAGVLASPAQNEAAVVFDRANGADTGIALVNPGMQPVTVTLLLQDQTGGAVGSPQTVTLSRSGHRARFLSEFFPGVTLPPDGTVILSADAPFSAVALRITGNKLSTVPVLPSTRLRGGTPQLLDISTDNGNRTQAIDPLILTGNNLVNTIRINIEPPTADLQVTLVSTSETQVFARLVVTRMAAPGTYRLTATTRNGSVEQTSNPVSFRVNTPCP